MISLALLVAVSFIFALGYVVGRLMERRTERREGIRIWEEGYEAGMVVGRAGKPRPIQHHSIVVVDAPTFHRLASFRGWALESTDD